MNTILIIIVGVVVVVVCVYVWQISFDIEFHIQSVTWCFKNRKWMWIHIYTFFSLKCHLNVTCLVICDVSICKVSIDVWFFLHKSYFMSKSKLGMSIDLYFVFCASFGVSSVKHLQKLCQKYTLVAIVKYKTILESSCWCIGIQASRFMSGMR